MVIYCVDDKDTIFIPANTAWNEQKLKNENYEDNLRQYYPKDLMKLEDGEEVTTPDKMAVHQKEGMQLISKTFIFPISELAFSNLLLLDFQYQIGTYLVVNTYLPF